MNFDAEKNGSYQKYFGKEHEMMRKAIREFISKEVKPNIIDWKEQGEFPRDMQKKRSIRKAVNRVSGYAA